MKLFLELSALLLALTPTSMATDCHEASSEGICSDSLDATGESCVWCMSGAVKSACYTQEESQLLPGSIFRCGSPGMLRGASDERASTTNNDSTIASTYVFNDKQKHTLRSRVHEVGNDLCDGSSKSISGYMDITGSIYDEDGQDKHLFFWMFEKRGTTDSDEEIPFVVWLTGGPGCSSSLALLTENGPCSVNEDGMSTTANPYSWTEKAHVLWLDQPAGVGYSYGVADDNNEKMIAEDAYFFLQAFFKTYPEYARQTPFLNIVGESYGGHYAPAIAHRVWTGNQELQTSSADGDLLVLPLAGLAVGNGLTDPEEQYKWYPEMLYHNSHDIKVVSEQTYDTMKKVVPGCTALIDRCNAGDSVFDSFACQSAFIVCNSALITPYQMTGLNPYDIRIKCAKPPLCYDFSNVNKWMNLESTKEALGVNEQHVHDWSSCNFGINAKFHTDWMKDFSGDVADLLNDGIPALIYAGDVDFICNYLGNEAWTLNLEWDGHDEFVAAEQHDWKGAGLARTAGGLTFLQVYNAGHMVPHDQPEVALNMIGDFLEGKAF